MLLVCSCYIFARRGILFLCADCPVSGGGGNLYLSGGNYPMNEATQATTYQEEVYGMSVASLYTGICDRSGTQRKRTSGIQDLWRKNAVLNITAAAKLWTIIGFGKNNP